MIPSEHRHIIKVLTCLNALFLPCLLSRSLVFSLCALPPGKTARSLIASHQVINGIRMGGIVDISIPASALALTSPSRGSKHVLEQLAP
jgi:hypothetical protein